jgi:hypothetical protein
MRRLLLHCTIVNHYFAMQKVWAAIGALLGAVAFEGSFAMKSAIIVRKRISHAS